MERRLGLMNMLVLLLVAVLVVVPATAKPAGLFARLFGATDVTDVSDDTGGSNCAGCAIIIGIVEQLAEFDNSTVEAALDKLCTYLGSLKTSCQLVVNMYAEEVIAALEKKETPDVICHTLGFCKTPAGKPMCHIFPLPSALQHMAPDRLSEHVQTLHTGYVQRARMHKNSAVRQAATVGSALVDFCKLPGIEEICKIVERWTNDNRPLDDLDLDGFSMLPTARGSAWRGKDCNDSNGDTHPGRQAVDGDAMADSNCNGILGSDSAGNTYEDLWCNGSVRYGTAVLGDSIGAHFHIPPEWMNVTELSEKAFANLLYILTNELDWPQLSTATGHYNSSRWPDEIHGPMDSLYQRMFELNRCNHRDYQNIAVNGARATAMADHIVLTLSRQQTRDQPLLIMLELVGNDVCSGHPDFSHMTPPDVYHDAQLKTLRYLDTILPRGSHILLVGLVDGRFLYNNMHSRIHPLGAFRGDVTYQNVYDYLDCLGVTPCWGWLNSNESIRNATTEHAELLNAQLQKIADTEKFNNFDVLYTMYDINAAAKEAAKFGKQPWQLVEPVDGFHANQLSNSLTAGLLWKLFQQERPAWVPAANPHNADIVGKFGDQGGY
ncbi:acyloxyacyl hydrolase-like [Sycon ciliatum]|uniref:acyloxyacyl hydrolase-like n=1 Tax=Sycon ciliatum TaxID=27933 RepID=UPI0020ABA4D7|eukprot:scpid50258/ scgid9154/ Acyloxyacyl hydrolase; Acyloxyacyl hydrolase small subunit; Acyloxyacyl hydrolase large subunit